MLYCTVLCSTVLYCTCTRWSPTATRMPATGTCTATPTARRGRRRGGQTAAVTAEEGRTTLGSRRSPCRVSARILLIISTSTQCPSLVLRPGPCRPAGWPRLGGAPAAARAAAGEDGEDGGRGQEAGAQPDGGGQPLMQRGGYIRLQVTPHLLSAVL